MSVNSRIGSDEKEEQSTPSQPGSGGVRRARNRILSAGLLTILVVVVGFFVWQAPGFWGLGNLVNIARDVSLIGLVAVGMTLLVLTGNIDLSVGAVLGLTGVIAGTLLVDLGLSFSLTLPLTLLVGVVLGLINGLIVAYAGVNSIITTLATWTAYRGIAFIVTGGVPLFGFPDHVGIVGYGAVLGIPYTVWIAVLAFVLGWIVLNRTAMGRRIYAIGGNKEAARIAGIGIRKYIVSLFVLVGVLSAFAGILTASRFLSAHPSSGTGFEIAVITAVFVGGISMTGGEGRLGGVLVGVVILGVLQNGMTLMAVQPFVQQVVLGAFLLTAVAFDQALARLMNRNEFVLRDLAEAPSLEDSDV